MKKTLLLFLFATPFCFGQNVDSLHVAFEGAKGDSLIRTAYYNFVTKAFDQEEDTLHFFYNKALDRTSNDVVNRIKLKETYGDALRKKKFRYASLRILKEAAQAYVAEKANDDAINVYKKLHSLAKKMGNMEEAQTYAFAGLGVAEGAKDNDATASFLRKIGVNYTKMKSYENAVKHLNRAIDVSKSHDDTTGIIYGYMSLGNAYKAEEKFEDAERCYTTSNELALIVNDQRALAGNYNNIASNLKNQERYQEAITYYLKAMEINKASGNKVWESYNYNNLGNVYSGLKQYDQALRYQLMSYELKKELEDEEGIETSYINLAEVYHKMNNYKLAAHYYDLYVNAIQSSMVEENLLNLNELSAKYEDEKKEEQLKHLDTLRYLDSLTIIASNESIEKGKSLQKMMWGGVFLLVCFVGYLTYSIRRKKKINTELSETQGVLSQKNKDLTDSINYARNIQQNILTSTEVLRSEFDETLIVYRPKDIVSGDFYWFKSFKDDFVFALADCTGHGVPGAFMSLICISAINSVTSDSSTRSPGAALSQIDKIVNATLNGSSQGGKNSLADGMDIALCSINKHTGVLQYAGAYRPLIVVRKGEVIRFRADKLSIGGGKFVEKTFKDHEIQLEKGDIVYLFSDGFPDQFGGESGKKLKLGPFLKILSEGSAKPLSEQEKHLEKFIDDWKGDHEQIDDISVIALRY